MNFAEEIRVVRDFPKKGISFKDITTLLKQGEVYRAAVDALVAGVGSWQPEIIVGPEARGFLLGAPVAYALGIGFVPVRKHGKLPAAVIRETYDLEYGTDSLEIHADAIKPGQRVAVVDDLLATGGTTLATAKLLRKIGAEVVGLGFLIELTFLNGRARLSDYPVLSLVQYDD